MVWHCFHGRPIIDVGPDIGSGVYLVCSNVQVYKTMTPSFRERLREILSAVENNGSYDPFKDLPSDNNGITVDRAFTEILSLVRGIVSKVYKGRYPELGDAPIEVMHFAKAILNEIGDGDATRKHDGGL